LKPLIENISTDQDAADEFVTFVRETCSTNTTECDSRESQNFFERLGHYSSHSFSTAKFNIDAEILGLSMSKLDVVKSVYQLKLKLLVTVKRSALLPEHSVISRCELYPTAKLRTLLYNVHELD